jgi:PTS system nitrogen regulatory IIA component
MPDLLTAKQLAEYLQLSPRSIYRLLERGDVPATKIGGQWRFRKADVDQWIDLNATKLPEELNPLTASSASGYPDPGELLEEVNAFIRLRAGDRDAVVRDFIGQIQFPEAVDLGLVVNRVLERERLCSTALPEGVALLHTPRNRPRVLKTHDVVALGRLERPVDFGALDGSLTDILVLILARDERHHLGLLAKIARLFREPALLRGLRAADTARAVVALVRRTEEAIFTVPVASS